jgi:uncharacterized membrane protein
MARNTQAIHKENEDMESEPNTAPESGGSSTGLDDKLAGLLTYLLGFVSGIIFLIVEKKSTYVRFHAMQSTFTFGAIFILQIIGSRIPVLGWVVVIALPILTLIVWILLMVKAFQGERFKLPIVGDMAEERANPS